jgi:hypothetical protein
LSSLSSDLGCIVSWSDLCCPGVTAPPGGLGQGRLKVWLHRFRCPKLTRRNRSGSTGCPAHHPAFFDASCSRGRSPPEHPAEGFSEGVGHPADPASPNQPPVSAEAQDHFHSKRFRKTTRPHDHLAAEGPSRRLPRSVSRPLNSSKRAGPRQQLAHDITGMLSLGGSSKAAGSG